MTSAKRSTLQLDLKALAPQASTPHLGRIGLVIVSAIAIISTVVSFGTSSSYNTNVKASSMVPPLTLDTTTSNNATTASDKILKPATTEQTEPKEITTLASLELNNRQNSGALLPQITPKTTEQITTEPPVELPFVEVETEETPTETVTVKTAPENTPALQTESKQWHTAKVKPNDTLSQIFNRLGLGSREAYAIAALESAAPLKRIRPGQIIEVSKFPPAANTDFERLNQLRFAVNTFDTLVISKTDQGFTAETITQEPTIRHHRAKATINNSLLGAANGAKVPFDVVYQLATIFGWQVDFTSDIQRGDKFTVIYEEQYLGDEKVGSGRVVAAELTTGGQTLHAIRHINEDNRVTYYGKDGEGIQGSFLRNPIKFARITSKFSKSRLHPIKKEWRAHKGVDYGAPKGTPIRATGDGVVNFAGTKGGYGRTIMIRHGEKHQTLYAHMSGIKKGIKKGARVQQGDIIGYVGKTGWATGNHLHYEFRVAGKHMNPLTVELPKSASLGKKYMKAFNKQSALLLAQLEGSTPLVQAE